jgi:hypothetical protein
MIPGLIEIKLIVDFTKLNNKNNNQNEIAHNRMTNKHKHGRSILIL